MITQERIKELLNYSLETGVFVWRVSKYNIKAGRIAGCISNPKGYLLIRIDGSLYKAHRLAWLYAYGAWPEDEIDHRDGNPGNNRISNLRDVTRSVNMQNQRRCRSNNKSSGLLGVSKNRKGWRGVIKIDGISRHLGTFDTPEEAHDAYLTVKRQLHEGCMV